MYLITGASLGIGFECARALLERTPARVMITARQECGLVRARASLPAAAAARLDVQACDQSRSDDVDRLLATLDHTAEPLTGVILNVGVNPVYTEGPRRLHALTLETIRDTITTNCIHLAYLSGRLLQRLRGRPGACVVWIGSIAAAHGPAGSAIYSASKSFLCGLARTARHEYGPRGVRVHLLHPGPTRTPRTAAVMDRFAATHAVHVREACDVAAGIVDVVLDPRFSELEVDL